MRSAYFRIFPHNPAYFPNNHKSSEVGRQQPARKEFGERRSYSLRGIFRRPETSAIILEDDKAGETTPFCGAFENLGNIRLTMHPTCWLTG